MENATEIYNESMALISAVADDMSGELDSRFGEGFTRQHPEIFSQMLNTWATVEQTRAIFAMFEDRH